jgi:hypothetical protein
MDITHRILVRLQRDNMGPFRYEKSCKFPAVSTIQSLAYEEPVRKMTFEEGKRSNFTGHDRGRLVHPQARSARSCVSVPKEDF